MKIKGQHGEFRDERLVDDMSTPKRQIEIGEGERISITVSSPGRERYEVISLFMPGVLTLEWEQGAKIDQEG